MEHVRQHGLRQDDQTLLPVRGSSLACSVVGDRYASQKRFQKPNQQLSVLGCNDLMRTACRLPSLGWNVKIDKISIRVTKVNRAGSPWLCRG